MTASKICPIPLDASAVARKSSSCFEVALRATAKVFRPSQTLCELAERNTRGRSTLIKTPVRPGHLITPDDHKDPGQRQVRTVGHVAAQLHPAAEQQDQTYKRPQ
jgi:hypothetical protein